MNELITITAALMAFYLMAMLCSVAILKAEKTWIKIKRRNK